jgi:hypothetical protein
LALRPHSRDALCFTVLRFPDNSSSLYYRRDDAHYTLTYAQADTAAAAAAAGDFLLFLQALASRAPTSLPVPVPSNSRLVLHPFDRIKGVNLGGWFIPEVWMYVHTFIPYHDNSTLTSRLSCAGRAASSWALGWAGAALCARSQP